MMPRSIFLTLAGALLLATSGMAVAGSHYVVAAAGNTLRISLQLAHDGQIKTLFVPGSGGTYAEKAQVEAPACNGRALAQDAPGNWIAPASCTKVLWTVRPLELAANGYDATRQNTARIGKARWIVFSESTSLLRVKGETGPATIAMRKHDLPMTGGIPAGRQAWKVPAQNDAPEFYIIGRAPTQTAHFGGLRVTYVLDNPAQIRAQNLIGLHAQAMDYLAATAFPGSQCNALQQHLLVLWLGLDQSHGMLNGAAGGRSFIANYSATGNVPPTKKDTLLALMVTSHEQFHQLTQMARRDLPGLPGWLNEALGAYYGITAARLVRPGSKADALYSHFVDRDRPIEHGLVEWNRRYAAGDPSGYPFFYSQGATFLSLLDQALQAHGSRLDALLPALLRSRFPADNTLPADFVQRAEKLAGPEARTLIERYVGVSGADPQPEPLPAQR
jgi:hypothetical protein